jgi:hypothetical protein
MTGLDGTPMPSYAESLLFGGDSFTDFSNYVGSYSTGEVGALKAYLDSQPTEKEIGQMSEEKLAVLVNSRAWSLVHFVKSLSTKPGLLYRLFVEDTEVTN